MSRWHSAVPFARSALVDSVVRSDPAGHSAVDRSGPSAPSGVAALLLLDAASPAASAPAWFAGDCAVAEPIPPGGARGHRASPKHRRRLSPSDPTPTPFALFRTGSSPCPVQDRKDWPDRGLHRRLHPHSRRAVGQMPPVFCGRWLLRAADTAKLFAPRGWRRATAFPSASRRT